MNIGEDLRGLENSGARKLKGHPRSMDMHLNIYKLVCLRRPFNSYVNAWKYHMEVLQERTPLRGIPKA